MKSNLILCTTCIMLFILSCGNTTPEVATSVASTEFKVTQATVLSAFKKAFQEKIWQEFLYENTKPSDYYWNEDCLMIKDGALGDEPVTMTGIVFCKTPELFSTATAVIGDVNSDGLNDAVILYGIEGFDGGNNYARFCSLFLNNSQSLEYSSTFNPHENLEYREYVELLSIEDGVLIGKKFVSEDLVDITELGKVKWVFEDGKMVRL